jgi:Flp pilus assembly CpaF family ATPase
MGQVKLSDRIVQKVAQKADTEVDELEPLYTAINPDALNHFSNQTSRAVWLYFPIWAMRFLSQAMEQLKLSELLRRLVCMQMYRADVPLTSS